jgi:hemerythrin-like metal-binding domain
MAFMEWRAEYSVRVAIFDDEHKKLIAIINQLHGAIAEGLDKAALSAVCDRLIEYTVMHFRHEELYFEDWAYPGAEAHSEAHATLREMVLSYRQQILDRDDRALADELSSFLRHWLGHHILVEDRAYGEYLYAKGLR